MSYLESRLNAQEEYYAWLDRRENLSKRRFKIIPASSEKSKYHFNAKFVGKPIDPAKLEEIFGQKERLIIQNFANKELPGRNWSKFAVTTAPHHFSKDPNMMFFEIGEMQEGERGIKIIYLGTGRTDKIPKIENETAADSWGFAVLNLKSLKEEST